MLTVATSGSTEIHRAQEELLRRRALPALFIYDESGRVVFTANEISLPVEVRGWARLSPHLPPTAPGDGRPALFRLPGNSYVGRVAPLEGLVAGYTALFVERFQARDHLRGAGARYLLTKRELEVVALLLEGSRTAEIAERLSIAASTVVLHIKSAMAKTGSRTRTEMLGRIVAERDQTAVG